MPNWIRLDLFFKDIDKTMGLMRDDAIQEKPAGIYRELILYLKRLVDALSPEFINRYFYFFEPRPHLFLALEVKDRKNMDLIRDKIAKVEKPDFVESATVDASINEGGDGECAIDFFHAGTKYAFFRAGESYKPGYKNNDEKKLVHCFCNQLFVEPAGEVEFYKKCLNLWEK